MSTFQPHWEILPSTQRELWPLLKATAEMGLVLYGGTAVALRLGHRSSVDFDFFTERSLDRQELTRNFPFLSQSKLLQDRPDTLTVLAPVAETSVKISFFGGITIGRAGVPDRTPDAVAVVASLLDLLAAKLKVIEQRIEAKDYRDISAILLAGIRLDDGLAAARTLYGANFQPSESMKALTYFEGGDLTALSQSDRELLVSAVAQVRHIPIVALASPSLAA